MFEFTIPAGSVPLSPRSLAGSIVAHCLAFVLLFALRFPGGVASFPAAGQHVTLIAPARVAPMLLPKARIPRPHRFRPPQVTPARQEFPVAPMIPALGIEIPKPVLPQIAVAAAVVKPGASSDAKPAAPLPAPRPVIKASGFQSAESPAGPTLGAMSAVGSFETAHSAESTPGRNAGTIARSGFSEVAASSSSVPHRGGIEKDVFGDTTVDKGTAVRKRVSTGAAFTPVEIFSKPRPAYTDEARTKNIEGEVLLEMQFRASGEACVLRVIRGLGHGLDENAIAAARGIRFRPAARDGKEVDSAAIVHIVFQLAN